MERDDASARGWHWLSSLPRATIAHGERGPDPLAAVRRLLAAMGNPHRYLRAIHVVGSKGKGSTALLAEQLLLGLGQRTLTFTSPHLERWTERLRIDGVEADGRTALRALEAVQQAAATTGVRPGFFEALTVAALWLARESGVDWCLIEAGVGGRADATSIIEPRVLVLTSVELEHTERLGGTLGRVATEKAGAIKPGIDVVLPPLPPEADAAVARALHAAAAKAIRVRPGTQPLSSAAPDCVRWLRDATSLSLMLDGETVHLPLDLPGETMAGNAALAAVAVHQLALAGATDLRRAARRWQHLILPARLESVSRAPWVIIDGAHTNASAQAVARAIEGIAPKGLTLLLSLSMSKDVHAVTDPLMALATRVIVTCADSAHSLPATAIAAALEPRWPECRIETVDEPASALASACRPVAGQPDHLVLATGSVYLAGCIRGLMTGGARDRP